MRGSGAARPPRSRLATQYCIVGTVAIILIELLTRSLSQMHRREEQLQVSEDRLRLAQQVAHIGVFDQDLATGKIEWTPELEALYGLTPGSFAGTEAAWHGMVHPDDRARIRELSQRAITTGKSAEGEWRIVWPDGSVHTLAGRWQVFNDELGTPTRATGVNIDVTNRRQMDAELASHHAEIADLGRVATIGELSASLAHELNQPLAAILSNAEAARLLLKKDSPPLEEIGAILEDICLDDARAGDVIRRMRAMLPKQPLQSQSLDVAELIGDAVKLVNVLARQKFVTMQVRCDDGLPTVRGDPVHLQQVLLNLAINAIEAMQGCPEDRRSLWISAIPQETERSRFWYATTAREFPNISCRISFEPFRTTKPNGMGMGLSIARTVVEAHGGKIWAENQAGQGAAFAFLLPVEGAEL